MITKKTFVTTSSFLLTAALLSQIYSFKNTVYQSKSLELSGFSNLVSNVKSVASKDLEIDNANEETVITKDIIKLIDKEISNKIKRTRYSLRTNKETIREVKITAHAQTVKAAIFNEDLSTYEINNSSLIELYAFSTDTISYTKFEGSQINKIVESVPVKNQILDEVDVAQASTKNEIELTDEITTSQPALEKQTDILNENNSAKEDEEMVMFDYSEKSAPAAVAKTIDQKLYERPISKTVQMAISREIGSTPIKKLSAMNTQKIIPNEFLKTNRDNENTEIDLDSKDNIIYDYSKNKKVITEKETVDSVANAFAAEGKVLSTQMSLRAKEINLSTHNQKQLQTFEFVPDYDRAERSNDQGSGEILFGYTLNGDMNTQTGIVQARGMISTRVELNLAGNASLEIPVINDEGMQKFLQKQGLSIEGNLMMLAIDSSIVDTEIDSTFSAKFYFDKNFKSLQTSTGAGFVMFAGVKSGNIMIRYLLNNKEIAQKIVYVGDGEMYFEDAEFIESKREMYTFTTRNLLGQKKKELNIDGNLIQYFNTNITAKKKALNAYDMKVPTLASGMRKYIEFKHLKDSVFVGSSSEKDIEIPGNDFIAKVLEMNQISSLKDRCVVQINLSKDLQEVKANGKNRSGEMFVETSYLDKDGGFSNENPELADKVFIVGDLEGQFNVKLDYADGSTEFLKTFCSEGSYLVEQL